MPQPSEQTTAELVERFRACVNTAPSNGNVVLTWDTANRLLARLEHLERALTEARDKFREYAKSHADKAHDWLPDAEFNERLRKSDSNREMAEMCDRALNQETSK